MWRIISIEIKCSIHIKSYVKNSRKRTQKVFSQIITSWNSGYCVNYSFKANAGVYIVSLTSCRGCRELDVFSSISLVLNVECVMWMWCRSWSLQREVRAKQTAGEQGISPLVMKAKDSGMDCVRGVKRERWGDMLWLTATERESGLDSDWFPLFCLLHVLSLSYVHVLRRMLNSWSRIHSPSACVHVTHRPCMCVCSAGAPAFKREILSHCSLSIKNQLPLLNECHAQSTKDVQALRISRLREFDSF